MPLKSVTVRATIAAILCTASLSAHAIADVARTIAIPAGDLLTALESVARQTDVELVFQPAFLKGVRTNGVSGTMTPQEAVKKLLEGTTLQLRTDAANGAMMIGPAPASPGNSSSTERAPAPSAADTTPTAATKGDQKPSFWDRFRLARAAEGSTVDSGQSATQQSEAPVKLEEIVVTAQKRVERLQEVPVPVSVLSAEKLVTGGQARLQDYYASIPGLSLTPPGSYGGSTIAIRGLVSGLYSNPTVGTVIDDVSYSSPSSSGFGNVVAEVDPSGLAHLEVLRGPQGTLYGASSLGGLLKYVTVDPDLDALTGNVQVGLNGVENADDAGYSVRGSVNVPVSDTWALRAGGFTREGPGYIDDPDHGLKGVNELRVSGGRLSALWRPSGNLSLKLGALLQDTDSSGNNYVSANAGRDALEQSVVPHSGGYKKKLQIYSANLGTRLGSADITAISAYANVDTTFLFDLSNSLGGIAKDGIPGTGFDGYGVSGVTVVQPSKTTRFTQEVRVSMPLGARTDWLFGAYYADEDTDGGQLANAADFATARPAGELAKFHTVASFKEYAAFTNFTFDITDTFDVQAGGRANRNKATYAQTASLAWVAGGPNGGTVFDSDDSAITYLLTPRLRLSPDLMMYARLASGYRPGGPNTSIGSGIPSKYGPDKTQNYELGIKGALFEGLLDIDASIYYIDWKDIQIALIDPVTYAGYNSNGSRAKSQGVELSVQSRPATGLILSAWAAYSDAKLKQDLPPAASNAFGLAGERLPYSSRFSGSVSVDKEFPLGLWTASLGASLSYVGNRKEAFAPNAVTLREELPAYAKADLRAGVKHDTWTLDLFVNNVADKRGLIGAGSASPGTVTYIPPRTMGLLLSRKFE